MLRVTEIVTEPHQQSGVAPPTFDLSGTGSIQQEMLTDFTPDYQQVLIRL
jgi:hypothetical protein